MASPNQTTRRDFLRGKGTGDGVASVLELPSIAHANAHSVPGASLTAPTDSLITFMRRAMACEFQIAIPATCRTAIAAASAALDTIDQLEAQMTVYDESSEISGINRLAFAAPVPV